MSRRGIVAIGILLAWLGGVGMLVRREYFRPHIDRLAEAALRVTPSAVFYTVMQGERQVGFASSTVDTATAEIEQRDYLVADVPVGGAIHRAEVRTNVILTRTLRLKSFDMEYDADRVPVKVTGAIVGDTLLVLAVARGAGARPDTQRVPLGGPMLMPTLVPLALALDERLEVGRSVTFPVFDQASLRPRNVRLDVRAESLFVVNDSSVFDSATGLWNAALPDTVRGWHVVSQSGGGVDGWVDEQGRLIASTQLGFQLARLPYEVAFENWQISDTTRRAAPASAPGTARTTVVNAQLLASRRELPRPPGAALRATIVGPIAGLDLVGGRQRRRGDTVIVSRELPFATVAQYAPIRLRFQRAQNPDLRPEPAIEVEHQEMMALADSLVRGNRDPKFIVTRIHEWIRDSVTKTASAGAPSALQVIRTRRADALGSARLLVALTRAAGVPSRIVTGIVHADGRFYHHSWAEVQLREWVAVDPTYGQFPASASHLRLHYGPVVQEGELERLLSGLRISVLPRP
ncbi:MAG TPA: transglutaminase-like domain-containing protein [Gemmatimonadaceae bacterium]|nr:transglutaminase-like domain-containing protein [Gemmatimonadaceae bacterium]